MEPIGLILELTCCLLESTDLVALILSGISWKRSAPNRKARREAKQAGLSPPKRDFWLQVFLFLAPITVALIGVTIFKWLR